MELGAHWGPYQLVFNKNNKEMLSEHISGVLQYMRYYPNSVYENIWLDGNTNELFSASQTLSTGKCPINHMFCLTREEFINDQYPTHQLGMKHNYDALRNVFLSENTFEAISTELKCGVNEDLLSLRHQEKVLIVGGGPSTKQVDFAKHKDTPVWTMNEFWKNPVFEFFNNIQAVALCDDVDINSSQLWDSINNNNAVVLQELSDLGPERVQSIYNKAGRSTFIHTRYRSKLGIGPRMIVLAIILGAKDIYFCGLDGYDSASDDTHSFESGKDYPYWFKVGGHAMQAQQHVVTWDYILNFLRPSYDFRLHDLSAGMPSVKYGFMQENIK